MRKILILLGMIGLSVFLALPASGSAVNPLTTTRKLNELSNRFNSFEANWGRFQIGGNFSIETNSYLNANEANLSTLEFNQNLSLFLDTMVDRNILLSLKMSHQGGWGLNYQSTGLANPITSPLQIDEAFFKLEYPHTLDYLGRFRFSFGPLGVISDFFVNPVEGLAIQHSIQNFHVVGLFSRVYTQYIPGTNQIEAGEDYMAARIGWANQSTIIGLNMVPNGVTGEKSFSIDFTLNGGNNKVAAELCWYSFHTDQYPDFQVDWTPGLLVSYGRQLSNSFLQLKTAYFSPQFSPSYSSLAHVSGDSREWFTPNSKGVELSLQTNFKKSINLENRLGILMPVENYDQPEIGYHLYTSLAKNFTPVNQVLVGIELKSLKTRDNRAFVKWNIQF
jgi:hypothetical protein